MNRMSPGTLLADRYELVRLVGSGGMGQVWVAFDTALHREVAVKLVDVDASQDPVAEERFRREATATASLSHDHVVTVFDFGTDGPVAFLVMELLPGPTVAELVRQGPLEVDRALELAEHAAAALAASHAVGVVHRDIKPGNLMLDGRGRLMVVDFGIARLAEATAARLTATSAVVGSAHYIAPEQASGEAATPATDLYALGCVLMAMLTGEPPFSAEHPLATLQQHLGTPPPRVRDRRPDVPAEVDALVADLLAKDPAERPAGAEDVRRRIEAIRAGRPAPAAPAPTDTAVLPLGQPPSDRRARRRLPVLLAAAAILVLLAIAAVVGALDGDSPAGDPSADRSRTSTPSPSRTPSTSPSPGPKPTPAPSSSPALSLPAAVTALGRAVDDAVAAGGVEEKAADDLQHRVEDLAKRVEKGDTKDFDHKLDDFSERIGDMVEKGELSAAAAGRIRDALADVREAQA